MSDWDFDYAVVPAGAHDDGSPTDLLIIASAAYVDPARVIRLISRFSEQLQVTPLFSHSPIFWTLLQSSEPLDRTQVRALLEQDGIAIRYLACGRRSSQTLGARLDLDQATPCRARDWRSRNARPTPPDEREGLWFLGPKGIALDREVCGTGAGTRLAVIDNDAAKTELVDLDGEVLVGVSEAPRGSEHAAMMCAWATSARPVGASAGSGGRRFCGVAPDASVRLYVIPKAGEEVYCLPLAIAMGVRDGADVIVCSTYVDGHASPMLDDALEFANRLGRGGAGTPVVLAASREVSSPPGSVHSSLSLRLGDPTSDPRVFCIGPSSRGGEWFLFRDRRGRLHPFANRGPALRWLAPGDDLAYPFDSDDRMTHAESSGAAAIAAAVILLMIGKNPELTHGEVATLVTRTAAETNELTNLVGVADPNNLLPVESDPDGHNAKHGYGRVDATYACAAARDSIAGALLAIGETDAALAWLEQCESLGDYPRDVARYAARAVCSNSELENQLRVLVRHLRLLAGHPERRLTHADGALLRQLAIALRMLIRHAATDPRAKRVMDRAIQLEGNLVRLTRSGALAEASLEQLYRVVEGLFRIDSTGSCSKVLAAS